MTESSDDKFLTELERLKVRLDWICEEEARSAQFGGLAASGHFQPERDRIIERTNEVLTEWETSIKTRRSPEQRA